MNGVLRKISKFNKLLFNSSPFSSCNRYYGDLFNFNLKLDHILNTSPLDSFINQYRKNGHNFAKLDPLNMH